MGLARTGLFVAAFMAIATSAEARPKSITAIDGTVKIKEAPNHLSDPLGTFRAGQTIRLREEKPVDHTGCTAGWYAVEPRGFVCATSHTTFDADHPRALAARTVLPVEQGYPYQYAKVRETSARLLRYTSKEMSDDPLVAYLGRGHGQLKDAMDAYVGMKVAWSREVKMGDHLYVVTPDLHLIRKDRLENAQWVLKRSVWTEPSSRFPFAIALQDTAAIGEDEPKWPMTALVPLTPSLYRSGVDVSIEDGQRALRTEMDHWIAQSHVSVFAKRRRPAGVDEDEKWVHVRVNDGSLIAYVGDRPVFAAVISPGMHGANPKKKFSTPTGQFRVSTKHLTSDMGGRIGQASWRTRAVPWVAYFHDAYALHGAWWHDSFGEPRSHGCVNLTPGDAHTLFRWLEPKVPDGWYAVRATAKEKGTLVVISP